MLVQFSFKYGFKKKTIEKILCPCHLDNFHHCIRWLTNVWFMNLNIIIVKEEKKIQDFLKNYFKTSLFFFNPNSPDSYFWRKKICQELVQCYSLVVCNSVQVGYLGLTLINLLTTMEGGTRVTYEKIQGAIIESTLDV